MEAEAPVVSELESNPIVKDRFRGCLVPVPVTSDVWTLIWSIKYILITKLITQIETNLRDESIKSN